MSSAFTFASPWALSPSGREALLRSFESYQLDSSVEIICQDHRTECVSLRCTEECFVSFIQFATTFYKTELEAHRDVFDSPKLRRIVGTSAMVASSTTPSSSPPARAAKSQANKMQHVSPRKPLIEHEGHCDYWIPSQAIDQKASSFCFPPSILGKVERLSSVRIKESQDSLTIMGDTKEATANAVRKLNVIEEIMAHHTVTQNNVVIEGATSFALQMVSLRDIPDTRSKTTLLSPLSQCFNSLASCRVVAMIKNGTICKIHSSIRRNNNEAIYLWQGHELSIQPTCQDLPKTPADSTITDCIATNNAAPIMNPFGLSNEEAESLEQSNKPPLPVPHAEKVLTKKIRRVKGAIETTPLDQGSTAISQRESSTSPNLAVSSEAQQSTPESKIAGSGIRESTTDKRSPRSPGGLATKEAFVRSQASYPYNVESLDSQLPAICGPFMPPPPSTPSTVYQVTFHDWEGNTVLPGTTTLPLIDTENESTSSQDHRVQQHKRYNTMRQRKSHTVAGKTMHIKKFEEEMLNMLKSAVCHPATQLHIDIGRILIDGGTIQRDFRKNAFDVKEWTKATIGLRTEFTGMLTSKYADAMDILNIKLNQGRRLFVEEPIRSRAVYVIKCQTKSNESIIIEIDDDNKFKIEGSRVTIGAVNWHFVKRAWDAQLVLSSEDLVGGEYVQEVQGLVNSIKISRPPCGNRLMLSFHGKDSDFHFHSMFLRRESVHSSTMYPDLSLQLTEVQDLELGRNEYAMEGNLGTIRLQNEMVEKHRLWWETSISSQRITNILQENAELDFGEKAQWRPEQIIEEGTLADMFALAQEIVTRLDHVGIENSGHASSGSKSTTKLSSRELTTGPPGYW